MVDFYVASGGQGECRNQEWNFEDPECKSKNGTRIRVEDYEVEGTIPKRYGNLYCNLC